MPGVAQTTHQPDLVKSQLFTGNSEFSKLRTCQEQESITAVSTSRGITPGILWGYNDHSDSSKYIISTVHIQCIYVYIPSGNLT